MRTDFHRPFEGFFKNGDAETQSHHNMLWSSGSSDWHRQLRRLMRRWGVFSDQSGNWTRRVKAVSDIVKRMGQPAQRKDATSNGHDGHGFSLLNVEARHGPIEAARLWS